MRLVKGLLERCAEVMERLAVHGTSGVSDIAGAFDLPKSAVHRLLQELCRLGWVEQAADGRYAASLRFALLGARVMQLAGLPDRVQPLLDRLAQQTRELVRLTMATETGLVWLASSQGAISGLVYQPEMAGPVRLFATANGKAYLAALPQAQALRLALADGLGTIRPTPQSIASEAVLLAELARVREAGYALADEEAEPGVAALAVLIPGARGTLSVAGPKVRLPVARWGELVALLAATAGELGEFPPFLGAGELACASS